jgi:hypothetical protein
MPKLREQQRLICALKNATFLPVGCCCLNDSLQNQLGMCKSSFFMNVGFSTTTTVTFG